MYVIVLCLILKKDSEHTVDSHYRARVAAAAPRITLVLAEAIALLVFVGINSIMLVLTC